MRKQLVCALVLVSVPHVANAHCWHDVESPGVNFATAKLACDDYVKKKYPNDIGATGKVNATNDPYIFGCSEVYQGNEFYIGVVTATPAQDHCYEMVSGPYRDTNIGGSEVLPGKPYTTPQKTHIKDTNEAKCNGHLGSDLASYYAQKIMNAWAGVGAEPCGRFSSSAPAPGFPDCRPQVHHFIPRVDAYGCGCGANSKHNALVVSAYINNKMSNKPPPQALIDFVNSMPANRCESQIH